MGSAATALARHASFFDPGGTGFVTPRQTWRGMTRLGVSWLPRVLLTPFINGLLGYLTQGHVSFVVRIDTIAKGKHPFDSGTFDTNGEIDPAAFAALFAGADDAITADEMHAIVTSRGNRLPAMGKIGAVLGHTFSRLEIDVFFCVAADTSKDVGGRPTRAASVKTMRGFYDGTLFPIIARRHALVTAGCVRARRIIR